jgi:hypothetical protein
VELQFLALLSLLDYHSWVACDDHSIRYGVDDHCTSSHHTLVPHIGHDYGAITYPAIIAD